ncbi:MAG: carbohydrate ABC transporter permease [Clostridiaceae bacterium]|jgi:ABC-type glycerol-3-phosphate transport system permease component|nr:carbohydrate ABC transporter permease [Clostridiaceae bacterium]
MAYQGTKINPTKFSFSQLKFYILLVPLCVFMLLPIVYIINQAFKPLDELFMFPPRFFVQKPTLRNFQELFRTASSTGVPMSRYLLNSVVLTAVTLLLTLLIVVLSGYALSKRKFRAKKLLLNINQMALMFVPVSVMIPRYLVVVNLGMDNSFLAHIVPLLATPVGLFLVKQFIDQIPDSILEAARLDGAKDFYIIRRIIIPLVRPALATVAILTFQAVWNSAESSNYYVTDETLKTFAFYLNSLAASNFSNVTGAVSIAGAGMAAASGLIMFLPNLIIFIFMQSKVMSTMVHSGIK